jgi:hypothetical protein
MIMILFIFSFLKSANGGPVRENKRLVTNKNEVIFEVR